MLDIIVIALMVTGLFFFFGTTIGLHRFPDFYTRMHAAGKGDTLSSILLLSGLALYNLHHLSPDTVQVSLKIMFICVVIFITSPTATHAIMDAGYESKVKYWTRRKDSSAPQSSIEPGKGEDT
ncbi:MAG: monovalent cation/H(+) antiporter subunit G [Desulfobulbaceae bacterium]|jgi:multicomponent Na+:H+ antiporter subunit G|nr:monovalent cation/H(+) antiporter subunit G [Desulfobulbaceae bacterium]